jgi:hypothetical protein
MKYKVLIAPVEPSINAMPNYSGVLATYDIEASSEAVAGDLAFARFCQENPYHSLNRDDYIISVNM